MLESTPFRFFSSKHDDPEATFPRSNTPLLDRPNLGELDLDRRWPPKRAALVVISGFLLLALFLAILIAGMNSDLHANGHVSSLATSGSPMASESLKPVSRGVSAGVSEKANRVFTGVNVVSFPWNNTMLSWQRTAYHFQPEKNWMNGM